MNLAIVGSRNYNNYDEFCNLLSWYIDLDNVIVIISGGAKGVDSLAAKLAKNMGIRLIEHLPNWKEYGKQAGFIRNEFIIKDSTFVVAFWDGKSKGTKSSIDIAKRMKIPTLIIYI